MHDGPVDWVYRPPSLVGIDHCFAVFVIGNSMEPHYPQGDLVFVNPALPVAAPCDVLIETVDHRGLIKSFLHFDQDMLVVAQHNPAKRLYFPQKSIRHLWRLSEEK